VNAKLIIQAELRNGITCLGQNYFTAPFKLANITEDKRAKQLHLMLMSSSPGILDGDEYEIKIEMGEGAELALHTQSYQRLFDMKSGARQSMEVHLQEQASFVYLPLPAVPHGNSVFVSTNKIYLSNHCRLVWGEIITCGRKLNGEVFQFSKYHNITEVFMNGKLVIRENLLMQPSQIDPAQIGQLEGFTHQASLIYVDEKADCTIVSNTIYEYLMLQKEVIFGVTIAPINGLLIRLLGYKAAQLYDCLQAINTILSTFSREKNEVSIYAK
jgi:urease accessory protein